MIKNLHPTLLTEPEHKLWLYDSRGRECLL